MKYFFISLIAIFVFGEVQPKTQPKEQVSDSIRSNRILNRLDHRFAQHEEDVDILVIVIIGVSIFITTLFFACWCCGIACRFYHCLRICFGCKPNSDPYNECKFNQCCLEIHEDPCLRCMACCGGDCEMRYIGKNDLGHKSYCCSCWTAYPCHQSFAYLCCSYKGYKKPFEKKCCIPGKCFRNGNNSQSTFQFDQVDAIPLNSPGGVAGITPIVTQNTNQSEIQNISDCEFTDRNPDFLKENKISDNILPNIKGQDAIVKGLPVNLNFGSMNGDEELKKDELYDNCTPIIPSDILCTEEWEKRGKNPYAPPEPQPTVPTIIDDVSAPLFQPAQNSTIQAVLKVISSNNLSKDNSGKGKAKKYIETDNIIPSIADFMNEHKIEQSQSLSRNNSGRGQAKKYTEIDSKNPTIADLKNEHKIEKPKSLKSSRNNSGRGQGKKYTEIDSKNPTIADLKNEHKIEKPKSLSRKNSGRIQAKNYTENDNKYESIADHTDEDKIEKQFFEFCKGIE